MQRLGIWSASSLFVMGLVYVIVVGSVMISSGGYTNPIGDPLLSSREALTLLGVSLMVELLSVHFGHEQNTECGKSTASRQERGAGWARVHCRKGPRSPRFRRVHLLKKIPVTVRSGIEH